MKHRCVYLLPLILALWLPAAAANSDEEIKQALYDVLQHHPAEYLGLEWQSASASHVDSIIATVYHESALQPLWISYDGPTNRATDIYNTLQDAGSQGLDPNSYGIGKIGQLMDTSSSADLAHLDVMLTIGFIAYANDIHEGRLSPREDHPELFAQSRDNELDPVELVTLALTVPDLGDYMDSLSPSNLHYVELRKQLLAYQSIANAGGWPEIPQGPALHPGETDERLTALADRLRITGDLDTTWQQSDIYNGALVDAVMEFQFRHGIENDGVIGPATLDQLNIPVGQRIRQIVINLERWRWNNHDLGENYILVDIAGFTLEGINNGQIELEMPVIVGKHHHESPVFSDTIKYIEFNPFWNITPDIARTEMLPRLAKDPDYLDKKHIRLFSSWGEGARELNPRSVNWRSTSESKMGGYKLRQDPGPWNALGTVKFVFPNKYSVYLHDTPNHNLFEQAERAFSHGCIRVSDPQALAVSLLGGSSSGWDKGRIADINTSGKRTVVSLEIPMPVHLTYRTAWVDQSGKLRFNKDIYGRDAKLTSALYKS